MTKDKEITRQSDYGPMPENQSVKLFPNIPPPTLRELKEMKHEKQQGKHKI